MKIIFFTNVCGIEKKIYLFFREAQIAWFNALKSVGKDIEAAAFQELIISEGMNYILSNSFLLVHTSPYMCSLVSKYSIEISAIFKCTKWRLSSQIRF